MGTAINLFPIRHEGPVLTQKLELTDEENTAEIAAGRNTLSQENLDYLNIFRTHQVRINVIHALTQDGVPQEKEAKVKGEYIHLSKRVRQFASAVLIFGAVTAVTKITVIAMQQHTDAEQASPTVSVPIPQSQHNSKSKHLLLVGDFETAKQKNPKLRWWDFLRTHEK